MPYTGWKSRIPKRLSFIDVETTGLFSSDRIVSIGVIACDQTEMTDAGGSIRYSHLIFDPGKKSHPKAEAVHGYDDWVLRHQERFETHAKVLFDLINGTNLVVAHNASFDISFIDREFELAGLGKITAPYFCTMQRYRELGLPGRASLSEIAKHFDIGSQNAFHDALSDAWMAMRLYFLMARCPMHQSAIPEELRGKPSNYIEPPPRPEGDLPRRSRKKRLAFEA